MAVVCIINTTPCKSVPCVLKMCMTWQVGMGWNKLLGTGVHCPGSASVTNKYYPALLTPTAEISLMSNCFFWHLSSVCVICCQSWLLSDLTIVFSPSSPLVLLLLFPQLTFQYDAGCSRTSNIAVNWFGIDVSYNLGNKGSHH